LLAVQPVQCQSSKHFAAFFDQMCKEQNAEGIVLRNPEAWYFRNNSFFIKKVTDPLRDLL
jgi:hypothetical protein